MGWRTSFLALFFFTLTSLSLRGETTTGQMNVMAIIDPVCFFNVSDLNFGSYDPNDPAHHITPTTLDVSCSNGLPYSISFDAGTGQNATFASRKMTSGQNTLNYSLYSAADLQNILGDGTNDTTTINGTGAGVTNPPLQHQIFGAIDPLQSNPGGIYSDTIQITVTY